MNQDFGNNGSFQDGHHDRLHPELQSSFVSLPGGGTQLTSEQLDAVFGGDRRALRDIAKLIYQTAKTDQNTVR
ncbi:MAG: hypothetical protein IPK19_12955 [Chloroflexi bacterium]|nr:hypothetical protein [Chloroflexota bacterium]